MDNESTKLLKELRKKREVSKKESTDSGRSGWKWGAAKQVTPYSYILILDFWTFWSME